MVKNYLLNLLQQCSEEQFGQDAIEWAVVSGLVHLTYDLDRDIHETMSRYDDIIEGYRKSGEQATHKPPQPAPMERAGRRRRLKEADEKTSLKRKSVA